MPSKEICKYLNSVDENAQKKVLPVIEYIEFRYSEAIFDTEYSEKSKIPTYRLGENFVGIGCRRNCISLYFSSENPVKVIGSLTKRVRCNKNSVNISYRGKTDYEALFKGVDEEFNSMVKSEN